MLENLKKTEAEHGLGGDYFKPQNGNNLIRAISEGIYRESEYKNPQTGISKVTKKFVMFIIDRKDNKVKPYFAPYAVYKQIADLEEDPFFAFSGMPMPYDINVKVTDAGTMNVVYNVQASPNKVELTGAEIEAAKEKGSILDYVKGLDKNDTKQGSVHGPADVVADAFSDGSPVPRE
jgi:hypothetical protein